MARNIEDIISKLPKRRRDRINRKADEMASEMIAYADSLQTIRQATNRTQREIGARLGMPQNAISQLEKRSDLLVSTLAKYVGALGAELDLVIRLSDGSKIVLEIKKPSTRKDTIARPGARRPARDDMVTKGRGNIATSSKTR